MTNTMSRFDVVDGFYWFFNDYHGGQFSDMYARLCRISRYFTPGPLATGPSTEESQAVYDDLAARWEAEGGR